jgi:transposase
MRFGLLQASFIPPKGQHDLRDLTRYQTKLVQERVREVYRVQGVLERANIKLASVISDIMGVSGRAMLEALIAGRADPATRAELAKRRMRSKIPLLAQALTGVVHDHHRQLLALQLAHIDFLDEQLEALNKAIEASLRALSVDEAFGAGRVPLPTADRPSPLAVSPPSPLHRRSNSWIRFLGSTNVEQK